MGHCSLWGLQIRFFSYIQECYQPKSANACAVVIDSEKIMRAGLSKYIWVSILLLQEDLEHVLSIDQNSQTTKKTWIVSFSKNLDKEVKCGHSIMWKYDNKHRLKEHRLEVLISTSIHFFFVSSPHDFCSGNPGLPRSEPERGTP